MVGLFMGHEEYRRADGKGRGSARCYCASLAQRNPTLALRKSAAAAMRTAQRAYSGRLSNAPPRVIFCPDSVSSLAVHSQTLPAMSRQPNGLAPRGKAPTDVNARD